MSSKPRILILIDWYLPGYKAGGPIASCANLIAQMKGYFTFSVITRDADYLSEVPYSGIKSNEWNILADGTRVFYFSKEELTGKKLMDLIESETYDRLYLNGIFSKYFTVIPLKQRKRITGKRIIVAPRGMLAESALAIKKWKKNLFLQYARMAGLFRDVLFHATNEEEKASIIKVMGSNADIHVAPNLPELTSLSEWKSRTREPGLLRLVNVARIAPEKNIKYALEVLQQVKMDGKIEYDIFGPVYDETYWKECLEIISQLPQNITVNYKGSIEKNLVSSTLSSYHFLFLPTRGENFGHVILQAMTTGTPVLISDKTMWKDLNRVKAGWDIPLSERTTFAEALQECAQMSQSEYEEFSKGAYDLARKFISDKSIIEANRQLFLK